MVLILIDFMILLYGVLISVFGAAENGNMLVVLQATVKIIFLFMGILIMKEYPDFNCFISAIYLAFSFATMIIKDVKAVNGEEEPDA